MNTTTNTTAFWAAGFSLLRLTEHITLKKAKVAGVNDREIQKPRIKTTRHGPNQIIVIPTNQSFYSFVTKVRKRAKRVLRASNRVTRAMPSDEGMYNLKYMPVSLTFA
jgi:hypothetical protein